MAETIKITSVYGVKDNGQLVNIVVEGNSNEIPYILITIWGKKQNRNIIRQISSAEFNESIEQEIIKSAQCECGDQITIKAFCLANSAISDTWKGELQCIEIGKEAAVTVEEGPEVEKVLEIVAAAEAEEAEEEKVSPPESLPLETPTPEKEEEPAVTVAEDHEEKEEEESVPKSFLFPTIGITTVKGFTYKGDLVDIVVEGASTGNKRILIKIQWGNIRYYKIVSPSSSGEFKSSFEQDISRSVKSEGGDQLTVTALSLADSAIFDTWQEKFHCVEKVGVAANTVTGSDGVKEDKEGMESDYEK